MSRRPDTLLALSPDMSLIPHVPMTVLLPNRDIITTIATASSSIDDPSYAINGFSDDHLHDSSESVATFTNDIKGSITLDKFGATFRDAQGVS